MRGLSRSLTACGLAWALGCTPFSGIARDAASADTGRDVVSSEIAEDVPVVSDGGSRDAAACGLGAVACDPVRGLGCDGGQRCAIDGHGPLRVRCEAAGEGALGTFCADETACAAGLHCVAERCLPLCCSFGGESACAAAGVGSHCAVETGTPALSACTLPGACDYHAVDFRGVCAEGFGCFPTSSVGESLCLPLRGVRPGMSCSAGNDCTLGFGCAGSEPTHGLCRRLCRLGLTTECSAGTSCQAFMGRPSDWGYCA